MTSKQKTIVPLLGLVAAGAVKWMMDRTEFTPPGADQSGRVEAARTEAPAVATNWEISTVDTNPIDGTRTQYVVVYANELDGHLLFGRTALKICFKNGKLAGGDFLGVSVATNGVLQPVDFLDNDHLTRVRVRFDGEKPLTQTWNISTTHTAMGPFRRQQFLEQLLHHDKLALEFSYYEEAPHTLTFNIFGLDRQLRQIGAKTETR